MMKIIRSGSALFFTILSVVLLYHSALAVPHSKIDSNTANSNILPVQLSVELGGDRAVVRRLRKAGYTEIKIVKSSFLKVRAEACLGRDRYEVSVKKLGLRVKRGRKIGKCRTEASLEEIVAKLRERGLRRIEASDAENGGYVVRACDEGDRLLLIINRFGAIKRTRKIGRCSRRGGFADIRYTLLDEGFNRIRLIERDRRRYLVEACRNGIKYRLRLDRRGRIRRERRIGRCSPPIDPRSIGTVLERRGFTNIRVTDRRLPGYKAIACRKNTRMEIVLDRFGDIRDTSVVGECLPPRLNEILGEFRAKQKLTEIGIFVEGCKKGRLMRYRLNKFGDVVRSERIGRCR